MALKTQGFALSALPRSPDIPQNIGKIDVKAIDEGVRQRLATLEAVRRAPLSMALADAAASEELAASPRRIALADSAAKTQLSKDSATVQSLPLQQELLIGKTEEFPIQRRKLLADALVAEAEATPEFLEARKKRMLLSSIPSDVRGVTLLTEGMSAEDAEKAKRVRLGLDARPSGAAIQYREVMGSDGVKRLMAVDPRDVGVQVIGTGETYGSGVQRGASGSVQAPAVSVTEATAESLPSSATNPNLFSSPTIGAQKTQATEAEKSTEAKVEATTKLPKALSQIDSLRSKTDRIEREIDEAIRRTNELSAGYGSLLKNWPRTEANALDSILTSIRANAGFDTLTEMRQNSPTGGALGNVSDFEGRNLQSTVAELRQSASPEDLKRALEKVRTARRDALERVQQQYEREIRFFGLGDRAAILGQPAPSSSGAPKKVGEYEIIEVR